MEYKDIVCKSSFFYLPGGIKSKIPSNKVLYQTVIETSFFFVVVCCFLFFQYQPAHICSCLKAQLRGAGSDENRLLSSVMATFVWEYFFPPFLFPWFSRQETLLPSYLRPTTAAPRLQLKNFQNVTLQRNFLKKRCNIMQKEEGRKEEACTF